MIKIKDNTPSREPLPHFLQGLAPESLADLSWTDPALGVQDVQWYPEVYDDPPYDPETQRLGDEMFSIDHVNKIAIVRREVIDLTPEEIQQKIREKSPERISSLQGMLMIRKIGLVEQFLQWKASLNEIEDFEIITFLDKAQTWERSNPILISALNQFGIFEETDINNLFIEAAKL